MSRANSGFPGCRYGSKNAATDAPLEVVERKPQEILTPHRYAETRFSNATAHAIKRLFSRKYRSRATSNGTNSGRIGRGRLILAAQWRPRNRKLWMLSKLQRMAPPC